MHSKFVVSSLVKEKRVLLRGYLCKANFFGKPHLIPSNTRDFFPAHPSTFLCHLPSLSCSVSLWSIALKFPKSDGFFLESPSLLQAVLSSVSRGLIVRPRSVTTTLWRALHVFCPAACPQKLHSTDVERPWKSANVNERKRSSFAHIAPLTWVLNGIQVWFYFLWPCTKY